MPHFLVDCPEPLAARADVPRLLATIHEAAVASGLFVEADIKVRLRPYAESIVAGAPGDFVHVFAHVMEGRTVEQRRALAEAVVRALRDLLPDVPVVSVNVSEFERATYANLETVG